MVSCSFCRFSLTRIQWAWEVLDDWAELRRSPFLSIFQAKNIDEKGQEPTFRRKS